MGTVKHWGKQAFGGPKGTDALLQIGGVSVFVYPGNPGTHISAIAKGDLCIDTTTPQLYQATGAGTGSWSVLVSTDATLQASVTALATTLTIAQDVAWATSAHGPVVADSTNGHTYRLSTTNGSLVLTQVT